MLLTFLAVAPVLIVIVYEFWKMDPKINYISEIKELQNSDVIIRDEVDLENKLRIFAADGTSKLQVIADFDSTLTKHAINGVPTAHSLEIFIHSKNLSPAYHQGYRELEKKYGPLCMDPNLTEAEIQAIYNQWWQDHELLVTGEKVSLEDIHEVTDSINTPLRDGCEEMLLLLRKHQVPLIVVSAGVGDVINHKLRDYEIKVVSNFVQLTENNTMLGFTKPTISVYNKNEAPLPVEEDRCNIIVLGDHLGDRNIADNIPYKKRLLKIGFFVGKTDNLEKLEKYRRAYDIVLIDGETIHQVFALLKLLVKSP